MAQIGLRNAKYNKIDYTTKKYAALTGNAVPTLGRLIDAKLTEDRNDTSLFADDTEVEHDGSFKGGSVSITVDEVEDATYADVKGCEMSESSEITENENDEAPEIGYGHILTKIKNGVKYYKVEFLARVQIQKITVDPKTKGESIEFNTAAIEGKVMTLKESMNGMAAGDWHKTKTFDTYSAAVSYLDSLLTPAA